MDEVKNQLVKDVAALRQQVAALEKELARILAQGHTHPEPAPARPKAAKR